MRVKLLIDFASKVHFTYTFSLRPNGDDEGPAVVQDVDAAERVSLVGARGRGEVLEEAAFVEVVKTS